MSQASEDALGRRSPAIGSLESYARADALAPEIGALPDLEVLAQSAHASSVTSSVSNVRASSRLDQANLGGDPPRLAREILAYHDVSEEATLCVLIGELPLRVSSLLESLYPHDTKLTDELAAAHHAYLQELAYLARYLTARLGINGADRAVSSGLALARFSFEVLSPRAIHDETQKRRRAVGSSGPVTRGLHAQWQSEEPLDPGIDGPGGLERMEGQDMPWWLSKILYILVGKNAAEAVWEIISKQCGSLLTEIGKAIGSKQWARVGKLLVKLFMHLLSKRFFNALKRKIGWKAAGKIVAKIAGRCTPLVGWGILCLEILLALMNE